MSCKVCKDCACKKESLGRPTVYDHTNAIANLELVMDVERRRWPTIESDRYIKLRTIRDEYLGVSADMKRGIKGK
jgi:hypothetical protein